MDNRRRYIFRGNAAAFGGQIVRPTDIIIEAHGASALPVTGGRSISRVGAPPANDFFHVDSAETLAEGVFEDHDGFRAFTLGQREQDSLVAATTTRVRVNGFAVGAKFRLVVRTIEAELKSRSPLGSGQPSIKIRAAIEGIAINDRKLRVTLDTDPFNTYDTQAKLLAAADDSGFVNDHGNALFMRTPRDGERPIPSSGRLIQSQGTICGTIVKSIEWDGQPYPGSRIEGNRVVLEPDFGVLYFGELLVCEYSRRLTMVRAALGSEGGGGASGGDVESGGQWA